MEWTYPITEFRADSSKSRQTLRDPHGLAILACIMTYMSGTVWVELTDDHPLMLHVLDLRHEDDWVRLVQARYERPLREIVE